jgi:hypothetical protein
LCKGIVCAFFSFSFLKCVSIIIVSSVDVERRTHGKFK